MGHSNGYRPNKAVRKEVYALREELAKCHAYQWQRAGMIMQDIVHLLGHDHGPGRGRIEPRACKYCKYYGHTKQWCPKRKEDEENEIEEIVRADEAAREEILRNLSIPTELYTPATGPQAREFDRMRQPFTICAHIGAVVGTTSDTHYGKWTYDANGEVILRHD